MPKLKPFLLPLFVLLFWNPFVNAQIDTTSKTTIHKEVPEKKSLFKRLLFKNKKSTNIPVQPVYRDEKLFQGRIIRHVVYKTQDPFGYSINDSLKKPITWLGKTGNALHGKTKPYVLRELVLFDEGQKYDSLKISESERLIRANHSIRRVEILGEPVGNDSIDLFVNSIDSWSMLVTGTASSSRIGLRIRERNFLGLGHTLDNRFRYNFKKKRNLYQFSYTVPNIAKTRISGNVSYYKNEDEYYNKSINFVRPFYSPLAHYAGGVSIGQVFFMDTIDFEKPVAVASSFKYNYQDIWLARAFRIDNNSGNENITNFITSARFYNRTYKERPEFSADSASFFSNQSNYIIGLGISSRRYVKEKFIFNYDIDEDIAIGKTFGIVASQQRIRNSDRYYLGAKASIGGFVKTGFFGIDAQFGGFFNKGKFEQKTLFVRTQYMSKLITLGRWRFRNFANMNYLMGYNRLNSAADQLSLHENDYLGMAGFRSDRRLIGQQKLMFEYQLQSYAPYDFFGFRISPFFNAMAGAIGNNKKFILNDNLIYTRFSLGIMLTNDYFVFNNIRLSLSFYPSIPGKGNNVFRTNLIDNRDYQMMDFDFSKPTYIRWNRWD